MNRSKKRIAVALGGNALGNTPTEQLKQVKIAADTVRLAKRLLGLDGKAEGDSHGKE